MIDLSGTRVIDGRFFGHVAETPEWPGGKIDIIAAKPAIRRMFRLNGVGFLLSSE